MKEDLSMIDDEMPVKKKINIGMKTGIKDIMS